MYPMYLFCINEKATERRNLYQIELESGRQESCKDSSIEYNIRETLFTLHTYERYNKNINATIGTYLAFDMICKSYM